MNCIDISQRECGSFDKHRCVFFCLVLGLFSNRVEARALVKAMLNGKSAIVTGSTSGIGLGIADALAASGAQVLLNGFGKAAEIDELRESLGSRHRVRIADRAADMTKPDEVVGMVKQAMRELGAVEEARSAEIVF